jgi:hypothetical protein
MNVMRPIFNSAFRSLPFVAIGTSQKKKLLPRITVQDALQKTWSKAIWQMRSDKVPWEFKECKTDYEKNQRANVTSITLLLYSAAKEEQPFLCTLFFSTEIDVISMHPGRTYKSWKSSDDQKTWNAFCQLMTNVPLLISFQSIQFYGILRHYMPSCHMLDYWRLKTCDVWSEVWYSFFTFVGLHDVLECNNICSAGTTCALHTDATEERLVEYYSDVLVLIEKLHEFAARNVLQVPVKSRKRTGENAGKINIQHLSVSWYLQKSLEKHLMIGQELK